MLAGKDQALRFIAGGVLDTAAGEVDAVHRARLYKAAGLLLELAAAEAVGAEADELVRARVYLMLEDAWANGPLSTEVFNAFEAYLEPVTQ